jgi:hypothetical protein
MLTVRRSRPAARKHSQSTVILQPHDHRLIVENQTALRVEKEAVDVVESNRGGGLAISRRRKRWHLASKRGHNRRRGILGRRAATEGNNRKPGATDHMKISA